MERYQRQRVLDQFGPDGQHRLGAATAVVLGVGGLGAASATLLARSGVGRLRIVDHGRLELSNLPRTIEYDTAGVGKPKVQLLAQRIREINPDVVVEPFEDHLHPANLDRFVAGADVILDGLDRFALRQALNREAVNSRVPYVYGAATGWLGLVLPVLPGVGPCLQCVFPEFPPDSEQNAPSSIGTFPPLPTLVASLQARFALQILLGHDLSSHLVIVGQQPGDLRTVRTNQRSDCPVCGPDRPDKRGG